MARDCAAAACSCRPCIIADALLLSTHNGMALEYANQLKQLLETESIAVPIIMGGVLNQKVDDQALPVTVVEELRALGMHPAISLPGLVKLLPRHQ